MWMINCGPNENDGDGTDDNSDGDVDNSKHRQQRQQQQRKRITVVSFPFLPIFFFSKEREILFMEIRKLTVTKLAWKNASGAKNAFFTS